MKVQEMISTFKTNNPELIERIKTQKSKCTNSISPIINVTSENSLNNGLALMEPSKNQEMYSFNERKSSSRNESNVSELHINNAQSHNYSANDANTHHVSVKSSTELLHTVSGSKLGDIDFQNELVFHDLSHTIDTSTEIHINCSPLINKSGLKDDFTKAESNVNVNYKNSSYADINAEEEMEICDEIILNNEVNESTTLANDTDDADALTQIIGEYVSSSSSSENFDPTSTDEELMEETIKEINLSKQIHVNYPDLHQDNLETIILTPPAGFRDDDC